MNRREILDHFHRTGEWLEDSMVNTLATEAHHSSTSSYASHDELDSIQGVEDEYKLARLQASGKGHTMAAQILADRVALQQQQAAEQERNAALLKSIMTEKAEADTPWKTQPRLPEQQKPIESRQLLEMSVDEVMMLKPSERLNFARMGGTIKTD